MNTPLESASFTGHAQTSSQVAILEEEQAAGEEGHIHLPGPSFWPIILSVAILLTMIGFLFVNSAFWLVIVGLVLVLIGIMGWALENPMATSSTSPGEREKDGRFATSFAEAASTGRITVPGDLVLAEAEATVDRIVTTDSSAQNAYPVTTTPGEREKDGRYATNFAEAASTGKLTVLGERLLEDAEATIDQVVTISSTAWSAHPVKVFVEREGVILSLYGKVELEAQKEEVEAALRKIPGVIDVMNFLVVGDTPLVKVFVEREGAILSLYGKVELEAQKEEVEAALRKIPGVIDVMNFLVAEDTLLSAVNTLIENLKTAGKLEGSSDLSVLVENGIVSLYGNVPTREMKYMLEREITGIPGARVVINHIGLNKDIPGNLGKTANRIARI